jgi:GNAT superfamily N-acetyltransferase
MQENRLRFFPLIEDDIKELTPIMKRAFDEDTRIHLSKNEGGPPGYDNGNFLRKWALHKHSTSFKVMFNENVIGAVIVWINKDNINFLGTIFIDPDYQNKSIGHKIWNRIEQMYPQTKLWRTETPGFSKRNHVFYVNKCGFKIYKIVKPGNVEEESYLLEKLMS